MTFWFPEDFCNLICIDSSKFDLNTPPETQNSGRPTSEKKCFPSRSIDKFFTICGFRLYTTIQSHILYSVKEHVQKRSYHQFKTSWCTKIKHFLED